MPGLVIRGGKLHQLYTSYLSIIFCGKVFSDKMDLTIQMRTFNSEIYLKFWDTFFTSLTMLGYEAKASICSAIKENLILYSHKFSAFVVVVIN